MAKGTRVRVGVGGWTFAPWRDNFFPKGLPQHRELEYAAEHLTAIEINGTYYRTQKPESFAKWRDETPADFVFSVKASRYATTQRVLADAGESVERFINSGIAELGPKLGPIVWQFMPTKRFEAEDLEAFLKLLPVSVGGVPLRHVIDARHESFFDPAYLALTRRYGCATVHSDSDKFPAIADDASDLAYLRLMRTVSDCPTGYEPAEIGKWVQGAKAWIDKGPKREVLAFFISGAKERAPAAAMEFLRQLG